MALLWLIVRIISVEISAEIFHLCSTSLFFALNYGQLVNVICGEISATIAHHLFHVFGLVCGEVAGIISGDLSAEMVNY